MKALYFSTVFAAMLLFSITLSAQAQVDHLCSQPQYREKLIQEHPELLKLEESFEQYTQEWVKNYKKENPINTEKSVTGRIIIPLVFHILNEGGSENIGDSQVIDEVRILNRDYNKQNADTDQAYGHFKDIIANMGVEWRLAKLDPNGNCTNGIDRITTDQTYVGDDYSKVNGWPRDKYVNVWLCRSFAQVGAAGYAYYPSDVNTLYSTPNMDGVIIVESYIGSNGTSTPKTSRALTHEIGHCFNLEHCWGNTNAAGVSCGDDGVEDTPVTEGWNYCPITPAAAEICTPGVVENYQNYMEYSYCSVMFTEGQKARWLAAANSTIAQRNNLWTYDNLVATGTYDTAASPCAPIAHFNTTKRYVCAGTNVQFLNTSGNGDIGTSFWRFPNGTPSTSTLTSPVVSFNAQGWQVVTLTVSNSYGSSTLTDSLLVYVSEPAATLYAPYYQNFESPNVFTTGGWTSVNYEANNTFNNNTTWFTQTNVAAHGGNNSVVLNNYQAHANKDIDQIISPAIDLTHITSANQTFSFWYSWATANQNLGFIEDSMVVYASRDCGSNWFQISAANKLGSTTPNQVVNAGYVPDNYVPGSADAYWKQVVVNIPHDFQTTNTHFKIQAFTSIHGNNLYIDDINIGNAATGIAEINAISSMNIFPNPTTGDAMLTLQLEQGGKVSVKVYDVTGKLALNCFDGNMSGGQNEVQIEGYQHLAHGVYIVNVVAGSTVTQKKLVVQ